MTTLMNTLPLEIENIINDYKTQLENEDIIETNKNKVIFKETLDYLAHYWDEQNICNCCFLTDMECECNRCEETFFIVEYCKCGDCNIREIIHRDEIEEIEEDSDSESESYSESEY